MSRSLSSALIGEMTGAISGDPFLLLFTMTHPDWSGPIRLVNNSSDIISRSNTYTAYPFRLRLSPDDGESQQPMSIELDNVGLDYIDELRSVTSPPACTLEAVLASNPDLVEISELDLKLTNIRVNSRTIQGSILIDDILNSQVPGEKYEPTNFRGIFA